MNKCDIVQKVINSEKIGGQVTLIGLNQTPTNIKQFFYSNEYTFKRTDFTKVLTPSMVLNKEMTQFLITQSQLNHDFRIEINFDARI